jgi:YegS/Rv2252/BmrU family lipid kinase
MKKLKLIYNPASGDKTFADSLDECVAVFQSAGFETHLFRSARKGDIETHIAEMPNSFYDAVVVSGGDGTVNIALNALLKNKHDAPLGIIPSGTANDFARAGGIPASPADAAELIAHGSALPSDVGLVGDKYFLNVCGAGFLTNISQTVDDNIKLIFGKLAYYMKGIAQLPNFSPLRVRVTNSSRSFEDDVFLFVILNSGGVGGFDNVLPGARVDDGMFDFIALRQAPFIDIARSIIKTLSRGRLNDPGIIYFKDNYIKVEPLFDDERYLETDVDGESGPLMPIEVVCLPGKINIFREESLI